MLRIAFHQQLKRERLRRGWSQEDLAERIGSDKKTVQRWETGDGLPRPSLLRKLCEVLEKSPEELGLVEESRTNWGAKPATSHFFGRTQELRTLRQWFAECRLIAVCGLGGIGKTTLVARLVEQVEGEIEYGYWSSLRGAPPLSQVLKEWLLFFSNQQLSTPPSSIEEQLSLLMELLRQRRCLLVLDNFDALLQGGQRAGAYRPEYEVYGRLLERLGSEEHRSVILVTSREKLREVERLKGKSSPVRSLTLQGLGFEAGRAILEEKGIFGSADEVISLLRRYGGNPLALRLVAETISELFAGKIAAFLAENQAAFGDIREVLEEQLQRLALREREVLSWLAIEQEAVTLEELRADLLRPEAQRELIETLDSLRRRSLIEVQEQGQFTLQPVIMEYIQDELVRRACQDCLQETFQSWEQFAFVKAQARTYVRESQVRMLLAPLAEMLCSELSQAALKERLQRALERQRQARYPHGGYLVGNVLQLLLYLQWNLREFDFSRLTIRQAYLQKARLQGVNFAFAHFVSTVFQSTLTNVLASAFSPDGQCLAVGTASGEIRLYDSDCEHLLQKLDGHNDGVWALAFTHDGRRLVSGSDDRTLRLWDLESGRCLSVLEGHTNRVRALALSPDDRLLVSGSDDQTLRLWDLERGQCLRTLEGHQGRIWAVALSLDGQWLASGDGTGTLRLWHLPSWERPLHVLRGHGDQVRSLAFRADGKLLASGSDDGTVRLWEVASATERGIFRGHSNRVWAVAFSPDGQWLASGSEDTTVQLWRVQTGERMAILLGHTHGVRTVSFHPEGQRHWLVSGGDDQTICLWDYTKGHLLTRLHGYTRRIRSLSFSPTGHWLAAAYEGEGIAVWDWASGRLVQLFHKPRHEPLSLAFSPDGQWLASGGQDEVIWLWSMPEGRIQRQFVGHRDWVHSLAFSPDGRWLASGSEDEIVRLWDLASGKMVHELRAGCWIRALAFRPGGEASRCLLVSGGDDSLLRLWDISSGTCVRTLTGHSRPVRALAFSPDGRLLVSGAEDSQVLLWDIESEEPPQSLQGHHGRVRCVAFSGDGQLLASSGDDLRLCLWRRDGRLCQVLPSGHEHMVRALGFAPSEASYLLASGGNEGEIRLWEATAGRLERILSLPRPYEGMNIQGVQGLSALEKQALLALGAVEESA
ncbi:helix-turn-helix domain-containing protein [Thermogemmatispora sp.]|uniref:WD40 domain-containing protein n=1 Tax=Thermogemmatispora sp. TaxID=1968838 RepID=UPI001D655CB8|nr:helix-turn-helix domain-containing protein [Thermogemmatispora sp.]MBX5450248.1 helix-turn-helix domain-containing protein [Thermogemmatispora sp.]